ncbi:unnamed protein product [Trichogramma brassicae]|uniref:Uncharacterized protein n=1 Tax=Trichogramma brassicae TaxID=86971 RepID=A0A6H5IMD1_9HYME|nr:unnamed protein product [Trichogramma brassicae]
MFRLLRLLEFFSVREALIARETPVARRRRRVRYVPASFIPPVCARDVYNMLRIFAPCLSSKDSSANDEGNSSSRLEGSKCVTVLGDSFPRKSFDDDDDGDEDGQFFRASTRIRMQKRSDFLLALRACSSTSTSNTSEIRGNFFIRSA